MGQTKDLIYRNLSEINSFDLYQYESSLYVYETAMKILNNKLNIIKSEYDREKVHSDIQNIKYRIKSVESISKKLEAKGLEFNLENIQSTLEDVVGARIICLTEDDVYTVVDMLNRIPSIKVVHFDDYITNPKESGYRSYHMIVEVCVPLGDNTVIPVKCEIQIRTLLMDAWSSLEHEIIYKNNDCTEESKQRLIEYSYALEMMEKEMESIRKREIDRQEEHPIEMRKIKSSELRKFKDSLFKYEAAGESLETILEIIKSRYDREGTHSDIQNIKYRIKEINSIDTKLASQDKEFTMDNIEHNIKDVVAARVICLDIDDVYDFVAMFKQYPGIVFHQDIDYIDKPKESGYRAYHVICDIPVDFSTGTEVIRCEVQFRTVLMDAWASLEHETIYKNASSSEEAKRSLKRYSYALANMDRSMLNIKNTEVENLRKIVSEELTEEERASLVSVDTIMKKNKDVKTKTLQPKLEQ